MFRRAILIGVGQIGASIGLNLVGGGLAKEVIGIGRNKRNLRHAVRMKAIHRFHPASSLEPVLQDLDASDLIVLAAPVRRIVASCAILPPEPLILDVGSTKQAIMRAADRKKLRFVGCHPIAGTEKSGAEAGRRDLFRGRLCVMTPGSQTGARDIRSVAHLWKRMGARTLRMEAEAHDRVFSATSHLPHAVAYSLAAAEGALLRLPQDAPLIFSSLKGTTRVAASPADMWRDIFLENRSFVLKAIDVFQKNLVRLRSLLARKDAKGILKFLEAARRVRARFPEEDRS